MIAKLLQFFKELQLIILSIVLQMCLVMETAFSTAFQWMYMVIILEQENKET